MNNPLLIGEVTEVKGLSTKIKVYDDKNTSRLIYKGKLIKNVAVGNYIKILKGYTEIIAVVEGEYISEVSFDKNYSKHSDTYTRLLEVKILGHFDGAHKFIKGINETPMLSNYVYILEEEEVQAIFSFSRNNERTINIGRIIGYDDYSLKLSIQKLFSSHIGIFGNTGSGKSNTLVRIFFELFNLNLNMKSNFVFIDFNGEYTKDYVLSKNKDIYRLNTRNQIDKFPISDDTFNDLGFWSIIFSATEKTQTPFLNRTIESYKYYCDYPFNLRDLLELIHENPSVFLKTKSELLELILKLFNTDKRILNAIFDKLNYNPNPNYNKLYTRDDAYFKRINYNAASIMHFDTTDQIVGFLNFQCSQYGINSFIGEVNLNANYDKWSFFEIMLKYRYIYEMIKGYSNDEHISPLIKRTDKIISDMKKVLTFDNDGRNSIIKIVDISGCNINIKKIVPLIICKGLYESQKSKERGSESLHLIIDEAHNILSESSNRESESWRDYRLEVFEEIIKEGRKFGCFLTISSQRPSDISSTIISQLHNYFIHRLVNDEDLFAVRKYISFLDKSKQEMIPILTQGQCICSGLSLDFPINVQVEELHEKNKPDSNDIILDNIWTEKKYKICKQPFSDMLLYLVKENRN